MERSDLPIDEPTRIDWSEVERRRQAHADAEEFGDLPEGQQSKAIVDEAEREAVRRWLDGYAARVRADVAEDLRPLIKALTAVYDTYLATGGYEPTPEQIKAGMASLIPIEDSHAMEAACDGVLPHLVQLRRFLADDAVAPAESVVGAPTPVSAPSDVAAPRDALTDQDFEGFNEAIKRARGPELFAQEGQPTCDAPHPLGGPACQRGVGHDYHLRRVSGGSEGWVALPEDEGTRDA